MENSQVIFEEIPGENGDIGLITLNRPDVLNALNHAMFLALDYQLEKWATASYIKAVVIQAANGRAFSAGGDIRYIYERGLAKDPTLPIFFRDEYRLNSRIFHFPKPYIALLDGITMGGGVGLSIHGSHRVATKKLILAMPETGIGFLPDVGATYFLPRLSKKIGFYLGLTGARIFYNDCFALGLVNQVVEQTSFANIISVLAETKFSDNAKQSVSDILNRFHLPVEKSHLLDHQNEIEFCFSKNTVEEIILALENSTEWCQEIAAVLKTKSPTSLKVTLRLLQEGEKLDFDSCMKMEYRAANRFIQGHDLFEGVRAVIIEKHQTPIWSPARLEEVNAKEVSEYFAPLQKELVTE